MFVTPEEKEELDKMLVDFKTICDSHRNYADTMVELISFYNVLVEEFKTSNPTLSLRIMNRVSDILNRGILNG